MIRPKKSLGQHFLTDPLIISDIIDALDPKPGESILEIGPGEGVLTFPLVNSGADIIAIELDRRLAPKLEQEFKKRDNLKIFEADILAVDPEEFGLEKFALIGNLPYNITSPILSWILKYNKMITRAVLMMQKEVALRIVAQKGKARSSITVLISIYYDCSLECDVPPESFTPPPKVDSAVVRFNRHNRTYDVGDFDRFAKFVRFCFAGKRKTLLNNLNSAYPLTRDQLLAIIQNRCGERPVRAEQINLETFILLSKDIFNRL